MKSLQFNAGLLIAVLTLPVFGLEMGGLETGETGKTEPVLPAGLSADPVAPSVEPPSTVAQASTTQPVLQPSDFRISPAF